MLTIFSDGGARGNPGPAASSFVIFRDGKLLHSNAKYLGIATNNVAEYSGVILALKAFLNFNRSHTEKSLTLTLSNDILFKMDSELVVKQLTDVYKIKDKKLMELAGQVKQIIRENNLNVKFMYVPRSENAFADKLVNEKLDETSRL